MSSTQTMSSSAPSTYTPLYLRQFPIASVVEKVEAVAKPSPKGVDLYARFAFAGAVCCSVTHGALTPVDVVKTRIQLEPEVYNKVRYFLHVRNLARSLT
jgi:solute carrier family 25 phosphate transporter 3